MWSHLNCACCRAVDPLDGTTNFAHSYPCFAVSVGGATACLCLSLLRSVGLHVPLLGAVVQILGSRALRSPEQQLHAKGSVVLRGGMPVVGIAVEFWAAASCIPLSIRV